MGKKNRKKQSALLQESTLIAEDLISETSSNSGATYKENVKAFEEPENEDIAEYCVLDEKIDKALEDLSHKNITLRENALTELIKIFQLQYIPDIIEERQVTLSSLIERSLKKGQSTKEQILGATLVPLFFIQIYCSLPTEEYWKQFEPILQIIYKDNSSNIQVREACLLAHAFCTFAFGHDPSAVGGVMDDLEACFRRRSPKFQHQKPRDIDDPLPLHQPDDEVLIPRINAFRKSALLSWALLLTVAPPTKLTHSITRLIPYFTDNLLDTQVNYELRVPTAQCLAVCYELDDGLLLEGPDDASILAERRNSLTEICEKLRTLTGENVKFISKRDQRLHRSIFRQVLGSLSATLDRHKDKRDLPPLPPGEKPAHISEGLKEESVKFGSETLQLATWVSKLRYDTFCQILGSGINHHLKENEMLRQIFDLGPPVDRSNVIGGNKMSKEAKHKRDLEMASTNKARTLSLQKARRYKDNAIQLCVEGE